MPLPIQLLPSGGILVLGLEGSGPVGNGSTLVRDSVMIPQRSGGRYTTLSSIPIEALDWSYNAGSVTVANDGRVILHPGEHGTAGGYGFSVGRPNQGFHTTVFDPLTNTHEDLLHRRRDANNNPVNFEEQNQALCIHDSVFLTDDGRMISTNGWLPAEKKPRNFGVNSNVNLTGGRHLLWSPNGGSNSGSPLTNFQSFVIGNDLSETTYVHLPDGSAMGFPAIFKSYSNRGASTQQYNTGILQFTTSVMRGHVIFFSPGYSNDFIAAGSSSLPVGIRRFQLTNTWTNWWKAKFVSATMPDLGGPATWWWSTGMDGVNEFREGVATGGGVPYEVGGALYNPKLDKVVILGGNGGIFTVPWRHPFGNHPNKITDTSMTLAAEMPQVPDSPEKIGVPANVGTTVRTQIAGGSFTVNASDNYYNVNSPEILPSVSIPAVVASLNDIYRLAWNVDRIQYFAQRKTIHIRLAGNTRFATLHYTSAIQSGNNIVFSGVTEPLYPGDVGDTTLTSSDEVCLQNPMCVSMDKPACMLPNGDIVFEAGFPLNNGWFSIGGSLLKWDCVSPYAVFYDINNPYLNRGNSLDSLFMLPDGNLFVGGYVLQLTEAEKTPHSPSWRPTITEVPSSAKAGDKFRLTGTTLNGVTEGGVFGDDQSCRTNFPIVRLTAANGDVWFCCTKDYTYRGIQIGRSSSCNVWVPADVPVGTYTLDVVASGIASSNQASIKITRAGAPGTEMFIEARGYRTTGIT